MSKDELEVYWSKQLARVEEWARTTVMSGAAFGDEDVKSPRFLSQCKRGESSTRSSNFIIEKKDWDQLHSAALDHRTLDGRDYKIGLFITKNKDGDIMVGTEHQDFLGLVEKLDAAEETRDKLEDAIQFLLSEGRVKADDIEEAATEAGLEDYIALGGLRWAR